MANLISDVDTIVIVVMENRSFDHILGYLDLPPYNRKVDGIQAARGLRYANSYNGRSYSPSEMSKIEMPHDPPHEREWIAKQLGRRDGDRWSMDGFIQSYYMNGDVPGPEGDSTPEVMGYHTPGQIPVTDFFARNFAICDRWFSSIPAPSQSNRLMAMSGYTLIDSNTYVLPDQYLVYDWLTDNGIRWRVYNEGIPFFVLMPRWIPSILDETFRGFELLAHDIRNESDETFPEVIFVEPTYTDAPHMGIASDDHSPTPISNGQNFLRKIYLALTSNPERWARTVLIITYDEHGGFFDHCSPPPIVTPAPEGADYEPFESAGVRVPALVISPLVAAGAVYSKPLDHTSVLQFLGDKFFPEEGYSSEVASRVQTFSGRISEILSLSVPRRELLLPPGAWSGEHANSIAFKKAAAAMTDHDVNAMTNKFPELRGFVKRQ